MPYGGALSFPTQSRSRCELYARPQAVPTRKMGNRRSDAHAEAQTVTSRTALRLCVGPRCEPNKTSTSGSAARRAHAKSIARDVSLERHARPEARDGGCGLLSDRSAARIQATESPARPWPIGLGIKISRQQAAGSRQSLRNVTRPCTANCATFSARGESLRPYNYKITNGILTLSELFSLDFASARS